MNSLAIADASPAQPVVAALPCDPLPAPSVQATLLDAAAPILMSIDGIEPQPGFNPRKYFNPVTYRALLDSVRQHRRIFQNIIVRPQPDQTSRYWIVAGERRWRASKECGLALIPALIMPLTDEAALAIAIAENNDRDNVSPAEEALAAQRMMHLTHGDRALAAERLNWSEDKLKARLALTLATEPVLMALAEGKIRLGHAELLSPFPEATQNGTLIQIIEKGITVEQLRERIAVFALDLATAIFDTTECQGCPHNTTIQAPLFEHHIGEGRCTNRACFYAKTVAHLQEARTGLRDEWNAVYLDTERSPESYALLLKSDVGPEQFDQGCKGCAHFGCLLSSKLDEAGKITKEVCFNLTCRAQKMTAYQSERAEASAEPSDESTADTSETHRSAGARKDATRKPARKKAAAAEILPRVRERIHEIHREAAAAEVAAQAKMVQVYALLSMLHELDRTNTPLEDDPLAAHGIARPRGDSRTALIGLLYALDEAALSAITAQLAGHLAKALPVAGAQASLRVLDVDLSKHWSLDEQYLDVHTTAGIEALLNEAEFAEHYRKKRCDAHAFKKLMGKGRKEIIKTALDSGFDFKGFVPKELRVPTP